MLTGWPAWRSLRPRIRFAFLTSWCVARAGIQACGAWMWTYILLRMCPEALGDDKAVRQGERLGVLLVVPCGSAELARVPLPSQCRAVVPYGCTVESLPVNFTLLEVIEAGPDGPSPPRGPPPERLPPLHDVVFVERPRGPWDVGEQASRPGAAPVAGGPLAAANPRSPPHPKARW